MEVLRELYEIVCDRKRNPSEGSYTAYLFEKGLDKILKKCGEECSEVIIAAKNPEQEPLGRRRCATCSTICWCCLPSGRCPFPPWRKCWSAAAIKSATSSR